MKKLFSILMVAFAMTAMVACGDKNEGTENNGGNNGGGNGNGQTTHLTNLQYHLRKSASGGGYADHTITFGSDNNVEYHIIWEWPESDEFPGGEYTMRGTYTYNEQSQGSVWEATGTLMLTDINNSEHTYNTDYRADEYVLDITPLPSGAGSLSLERVREK